ncbi:putative spfh domain / Band 7 family protein [Schistosoma mansoni]|uniref:Putative spfh domain / Band 7 family protein n=1 Tax=Schistosoma mansoni TaxID=6183 RepID=G4V6P0_SCHMA|nr:putative spfh domain / Band 7 family protein [Schistosoma mansoni]|eukprot:XP_018647678.1 putative spfh domain / Band 7 family protein [Schistosoma mansoni]
MRLPILLNRYNEQKILIEQLNHNSISLENIESSITSYFNQTIKLFKLNIFMMDNLEQSNMETMKSNSLLKSDETQSVSKNPMVPLSHLTNTKEVKTDPLGLVIAKRKRKEMADPQIAEAILSASKLPPPIVPETTNSVDVPEELLQILALAKDYDKDDTENIDFFKNYSLIQPRKPLNTQVNNVTYMKRERLCKLSSLKKYFITKDFMEDTEETRTLVQNTVHTDEEWFMESFLHVLCILLIIITLPLSLIFCLKVVTHYERAVLFRLGRLVSATAKGPGLIFVLPCLDRYRVLDLRTFTFDVPTQEVLTKDSVTVVVNAVVYYRVRDPVRAVVNVEDANRATRVLGQTTLLNVLGTVNLEELLTAREDIAALMQECLDSVTEAWGVKVERVEIKDVRLPIQLQRAMAAEAESVREATAKVIAAEGEMRASGALKAAAVEIKQHPIAMQLRYLQTVNSISSGKQSTIIFPVPLDLTSLFRAQLDNILCGNLFENVNFKADNQLQFLHNNNNDDEDSNEYENEEKDDLYKVTNEENILTSSLKLPYQMSTNELMESLSQIV